MHSYLTDLTRPGFLTFPSQSPVAQLVKNPPANAGVGAKRRGFDPWVRKMPWRRQPTPGFLPGKSHRQRSLAGHSPWSHKELDMTEHAYTAINRNWPQRPNKKFRQGFTGVSAAAGGAKTNKLASKGGGDSKLFLMLGEGRGVPRVGLEGWLRSFANPLGGDVRSGHVQYPAFAPGSSKVAVGFGFPFSGLFFLIFCPEFVPAAHATQLFLVPYSFFVSCCPRRGVSRCKH